MPKMDLNLFISGSSGIYLTADDLALFALKRFRQHGDLAQKWPNIETSAARIPYGAARAKEAPR